MGNSRKTMPWGLAYALTLTDLAFLFYWTISTLAQIGLIHIPPSLMYDHYNERQVAAWNWSFLPIDMLFSSLGLAAVIANRRGRAIWRPLALLSLAFTMAAGAMAVSYWTILAEFNASWFLPNLLLALWPLLFIPRLISGGQEIADNVTGDNA